MAGPTGSIRLNFGAPNSTASPKAATLLREPLLRGSGQHDTIRLRQQDKNKKQLSPWAVLRLLPNEVYIVLLVDLLNSYRSFGFRSVQYTYLVNEFGISDLEAGSYLGIQAWLMVVFGMLGSMLVDAWGVRQTAICALSVAACSRGLLAFGRDRTTLLVALLGLAPFGEAVLSTGIYTVALKKLTTPATRGLAFGVQYGVFNLAGALADVAADVLRHHDVVLPHWLPLVGGSYWSGLRVHVFFTWIAVLGALAICQLFLHDTVVVPLDDDDALAAKMQSSPPYAVTPGLADRLRREATDAERARGYAVRIAPARASSRAASPINDSDDDEEEVVLSTGTLPTGAAAASRTPRRPKRGCCHPLSLWRLAQRVTRLACDSAMSAYESISELLRLRSFWRALWLSCSLLFVSKQWGDMDQLLPPFLERNYGENVPIFTIHSINMWIGMIGPSVAAALTMHMEAFRVMIPGLWIMALSPLWLALDPSVKGVVVWITFLSIGEVLWSPRLSAWIASVAPDGREGAFLALLSMKNLITTIPSTALNGWMNDAFNPNCPACRDDRSGHFCSVVAPINASFDGCRSPTSHALCIGKGPFSDYSPAMIAPHGSGLHCPTHCHQCPGWSGSAQTMWMIVLISSISSPILVSLSVRFLREKGESKS